MEKDMDEMVCLISDEVQEALEEYSREEVASYLNAALNGNGFAIVIIKN